MTKNSFKFPMSVRERVGGLIYIPMHSVLVPFLVVLIDSLAGGNTSESVLNLIIYAVGFAFCLLFMWKFLKQSFGDIFDAPGFLRIVVGNFFLNYLLAVIASTVVTAILGDYELLTNPNSEGINSLVKENFNVTAVMTVVFAPVVEECVFRGALFGTLRTKSRFLAYCITIFVFSIYHLWSYFLADYSWHLWVYLLQYVPGGFVLCRAYEKSGTIWCPIVLHALINFVALSVVKLL